MVSRAGQLTIISKFDNRQSDSFGSNPISDRLVVFLIRQSDLIF
jgi:hypothetical protein